MTGDDPFEVIVIGAGFSGICAAIQLLQAGISRLCLLEKAEGVGGTWWENTYPGAACDVPSHFYCYSFAPNPNWSRQFSPQAEIQRYAEQIVDQFGVRPYIRFAERVTAVQFDAATGTWWVSRDKGADLQARFVINASGALHKPNIPKFPGAELFHGVQMHTAQWQPTFDPSGKRIAVIGSAASAIQVVPELAKSAALLKLFQRTPNYIAPRNDFAFARWQKALFQHLPLLNRLYRWVIFAAMDRLLYPVVRRPAYRRKRGEKVKKFMRRSVKDHLQGEILQPDYEFGCRRILISDDYLPALNLDNVALISSPICRFLDRGIVTADGMVHDLDAIIYATGFDVAGHVRSLAVQGEEGVTLDETWREGAIAYRGVMVPGFPNYFLTTGPNTGVGTTSVIFMIEQAVQWIVKCIQSVPENGVVAVKAAAATRYNADVQADLGETVWASGCRSWYHRDDGRIETLYPHNAASYRKLMQSVDFGDLDVRQN